MNRYCYALSAAFYADIAQAETVRFIFVQTREPYEVTIFEMLRQQLQDGCEQYQSALRRFDECWKARDWPEAVPVADLDDDPLMMNFMSIATKHSPGRFDLPVGELAL